MPPRHESAILLQPRQRRTRSHAMPFTISDRVFIASALAFTIVYAGASIALAFH